MGPQQRDMRLFMDAPPCMVWLPVDHRLLGEDGLQTPYLVLGDKYARAVRDSAHGQAVLFPLAGAAQISDLLALVDGVMLTGSPSNIDPTHFSQPVADPSLPLDPHRDALTLALVRAWRRSTPCMVKVWHGWHRACVQRGVHRTVWSRRFRCRAHAVLQWRCSGIRNGAVPRTRFLHRYFLRLVRPAGNGRNSAWALCPQQSRGDFHD